MVVVVVVVVGILAAEGRRMSAATQLAHADQVLKVGSIVYSAANGQRRACVRRARAVAAKEVWWAGSKQSKRRVLQEALTWTLLETGKSLASEC